MFILPPRHCLQCSVILLFSDLALKTSDILKIGFKNPTAELQLLDCTHHKVLFFKSPLNGNLIMEITFGCVFGYSRPWLGKLEPCLKQQPVNLLNALPLLLLLRCSDVLVVLCQVILQQALASRRNHLQCECSASVAGISPDTAWTTQRKLAPSHLEA